MIKHRLYVQAMALCLCAGVVAGCGGGSGENAGRGEGVKSKPLHVMTLSRFPLKNGQSGCDSGSARVGASPRVIDLEVSCFSPRPKEWVQFSAGQYVPNHPLARRRPVGFQPEARVIGSKGEERRAKCRRRGTDVECAARISGAAKLRLKLYVDEGTRCSFGVGVVSHINRPCKEVACYGAALLDGSFRGRPRGC